MNEPESILATARAREAARQAAYVPIDYAAAAKEHRAQKGALTRAVKKGKAAVLVACRDAVQGWNKPARAWPDDWSRWQRALDDAFPYGGPQAPRLEDLS